MSALLAHKTRNLALKNVDRLPSLSPALNQLLGLLAKRDVDMRQLSRVITTDAPLCGHILSAANSAMFGRGSQVRSIEQAVARIGLGKLRMIALSKSVSGIFRGMRTPPGWSMARFQLHSVAAGAAADILCGYLPVEDGEHAFLGGLMHDVGKILIATGQTTEYIEIENLMVCTGRSQIDVEHEILGTDHAELSGLAVAKWELPFSLARAVANHHCPEAPRNPNEASLSAILQASDRFINSLGISVRAAQGEPEPPELPVIAGFEYDEKEFAGHFADGWRVLSAICM